MSNPNQLKNALKGPIHTARHRAIEIRQMQYVDEMLAEREQMQQLMNMLIYENADVFYVPVGRMAA